MSLDSLVSTTDLATYLQQNLEEYETEAANAVELASAAVRAYCRRSLTYVVDDERVLRWRPTIVLPDPPIVEITSVQIAGEDVDWYRDLDGRLVVNAAPPLVVPETNYPYPDVTITYTHGYLTVPAVVAMVAVRIAARVFKNPMQRVAYNADTMNYSSGVDIAPRILTGDEMLMLKPYRLNRVYS